MNISNFEAMKKPALGQSPMQALLTAPTKFKPRSSYTRTIGRTSNSIIIGNPATPKRRRLAGARAESSSPCTPTSNLKLLTKIASLEEEQLQVLARKALFHKDRNCPQAMIDKIKLAKFESKVSSLGDCSDYDDENQEPNSRRQDASIELDNLMSLINEEQNNKENLYEPNLGGVQSRQSTPTVGLTYDKRRPFSSYCSSIGDEEEIPLSPDLLVDQVFLDTSSGYGTSSITPSSSNNTTAAAVWNTNNSENNFSFTNNNTSVSWRRNSSTSTTTSNNTTINNENNTTQDSQEKLQKQPSETSRRDKSLGLLGERFLELFPLTCCPLASPRRLVLDEVAAQLCTERRRIYDIVNVLESLAMATKIGKNIYQWSGSNYLKDTLARLQALGTSLGLPRLIETTQVFRFPPVSGTGGDTRREKSLGIICQKLLMLLLALPPPRVLSMEFAVQVIVCSEDGSEPSSPSLSRSNSKTTNSDANRQPLLTRNDSGNKSNNKRLFARNDSTNSEESTCLSSTRSILVPSTRSIDTMSVKSSCSSGGRVGAAIQQQRARGRRMYDIVNVLSALGLVTRLPASRSLQYAGPTDLPHVDPTQDIDVFSSCQRQSLLRNHQITDSGGHKNATTKLSKVESVSSTVCSNYTGWQKLSSATRPTIFTSQINKNVSNTITVPDKQPQSPIQVHVPSTLNIPKIARCQSSSNVKRVSGVGTLVRVNSSPVVTSTVSGKIHVGTYVYRTPSDLLYETLTPEGAIGVSRTILADQRTVSSHISAATVSPFSCDTSSNRSQDTVMSHTTSSRSQDTVMSHTTSSRGQDTVMPHTTTSRSQDTVIRHTTNSGSEDTLIRHSTRSRSEDTINENNRSENTTIFSHNSSSKIRNTSSIRLPRINSEGDLTKTLSRKTSSLFEVAELELERLLSEEREEALQSAREAEHAKAMKQVQYLVSPVYSRHLMARKKQHQLAATTSISAAKFAVPKCAPPRSPLFLSQSPQEEQHASGRTYVKPNINSPRPVLLKSIDQKRIITLTTKQQSVRVLPRLPSPRVALSFPPDAPMNLVVRPRPSPRGGEAEGAPANSSKN